MKRPEWLTFWNVAFVILVLALIVGMACVIVGLAQSERIAHDCIVQGFSGRVVVNSDSYCFLLGPDGKGILVSPGLLK